MITARNPVHAALFLVLAFFTAAGIWLLLEAEFLAIALVLVYVGAVMVLFLFVVMMLDINLEPLREGFCALLAGRLRRRRSSSLLEMAAVLIARLLRSTRRAGADAARRRATATPSWLGIVLYTQLPAIRSRSPRVILLVAIVAAIALTLRQRARTSRRRRSAEQVAVAARATACASSRCAPDEAPRAATADSRGDRRTHDHARRTS